MEPPRSQGQATGSLKESVLEMLRQEGGKTVRDLAEATGASIDVVRALLNKAEQAGQVKRDGTAERVPGQLGKPLVIWRLGGGYAGSFSEASRTAMEKLAGDAEGAKERRAAGRAQQQVERDREKEALKGLKKLASEAAERAQDHGAVGELQMLQRIKALGAAKRADDWQAIEAALLDVAACALSWAARVGHAESAERLLPATAAIPEPVSDAPLNGSSKSVAERYADVLLAAAAEDLDGAEARATIERLLGIGL